MGRLAQRKRRAKLKIPFAKPNRSFKPNRSSLFQAAGRVPKIGSCHRQTKPSRWRIVKLRISGFAVLSDMRMVEASMDQISETVPRRPPTAPEILGGISGAPSTDTPVLNNVMYVSKPVYDPQLAGFLPCLQRRSYYKLNLIR